jgi:hypothetical protein
MGNIRSRIALAPHHRLGLLNPVFMDLIKQAFSGLTLENLILWYPLKKKYVHMLFLLIRPQHGVRLRFYRCIFLVSQFLHESTQLRGQCVHHLDASLPVIDNV